MPPPHPGRNGADAVTALVSGLTVYPVKSFVGQAVDRAEVHRWGLAGDRRWGLVDEAGHKLTGLIDPRVLRLKAELRGEGGVLLRSGREEFEAHPPTGPASPIGGATGAVGIDAGPAAERWITQHLGRPARLVWQPDPADRPVPTEHGGREGDALTLSWSGPILLTTTSSLRRLQEWIEVSAAERGEEAPQIEMERFRPNVVVDGSAPFVEDGWDILQIGEVRYRVSEQCDRCAVTLVDTTTWTKGAEPIRTLARHRQRHGAVWFGVRLVPLTTGWISVGDGVRPGRR